MVSPPWAGASSDEQYFVLLTGANSGVGLGIGQRIIDEFLSSRSLSSHLILIPTTRTAKKSRDTILALRAHLEKTAHSSPQLLSRVGPDYDPQITISRVHVLSLQLDLCDLRSVYAAADQLVHSKLTDPTGQIQDVSIPRLDAAIFNAGIGGWEGLDWLKFAGQFISVGLVQSTTFPVFKKALPAAILDQQKLLGPGLDGSSSTLKDPPALAEVFCANVFGHYVLAHELLPLLARSTPNEAPARVIWTSSIDAGHEHLSLPDFQATRSRPPYESSKRITDLLALTADLPSVRPISTAYFSPPSSSSSPTIVKPRFYLSHPGIVCTPLFPLNALLFFCYWVVMYVSRWLGSPWHPVEPYGGAAAPAWLALESQPALDALRADRAKWGSSTDRSGHPAPKRTEVEGWGWEGEIEDARADDAPGVLSKAKGRKWDAVALTKEARESFEDDGRRCWEELERLRGAWEAALGRRHVKGKA
ncbi:hypothetical protein F5Y15DRAFT_169575 [Xylariaceae sp. FL0016]|nr:hypothetical protein F5Y15DRAFT_169575 [Xylariaceae sp. FL0016]